MGTNKINCKESFLTDTFRIMLPPTLVITTAVMGILFNYQSSARFLSERSVKGLIIYYLILGPRGVDPRVFCYDVWDKDKCLEYATDDWCKTAAQFMQYACCHTCREYLENHKDVVGTDVSIRTTHE